MDKDGLNSPHHQAQPFGIEEMPNRHCHSTNLKPYPLSLPWHAKLRFDYSVSYPIVSDTICNFSQEN